MTVDDNTVIFHNISEHWGSIEWHQKMMTWKKQVVSLTEFANCDNDAHSATFVCANDECCDVFIYIL